MNIQRLVKHRGLTGILSGTAKIFLPIMSCQLIGSIDGRLTRDRHAGWHGSGANDWLDELQTLAVSRTCKPTSPLFRANALELRLTAAVLSKVPKVIWIWVSALSGRSKIPVTCKLPTSTRHRPPNSSNNYQNFNSVKNQYTNSESQV